MFKNSVINDLSNKLVASWDYVDCGCVSDWNLF